MNVTLTLRLDGPDADEALDDLLSIDGLRSEVLPEETPQVRGDPDYWLSVTANILEIAFATGWAVQKIREWWEKQRAVSPRLTCTIEGPGGARLDLNSATAEQVAAVLALLCQDTKS